MKRAQYAMDKKLQIRWAKKYIIWPTWPDKGQAGYYPSNKKRGGEELKRMFSCTLDFIC